MSQLLHTTRGRARQLARPRLVLATGALAIVLSACGGGTAKLTGSESALTTVKGASAIPLGAATTAAPAKATSPMAPLLTSYAAGYDFTTTVKVADQLDSQVKGRRSGTGTSMTVTVNGVSIDEIVTPEGAWVRQNGQAWEQVTTAQGAADPMAALGAPTKVSIKGDAVTATYPADAFGLPKGDLNVTMNAAGGKLNTIHYETKVAGKAATVDTTFAPLSDPAAIVKPV